MHAGFLPWFDTFHWLRMRYHLDHGNSVASTGGNDLNLSLPELMPFLLMVQNKQQ